jgi:hypothetical protein
MAQKLGVQVPRGRSTENLKPQARANPARGAEWKPKANDRAERK